VGRHGVLNECDLVGIDVHLYKVRGCQWREAEEEKEGSVKRGVSNF